MNPNITGYCRASEQKYTTNGSKGLNKNVLYVVGDAIFRYFQRNTNENKLSNCLEYNLQ